MLNSKTEEDDRNEEAAFLEREKVAIDVVKHLTTLAAGIMVLGPALLQIIKPPLVDRLAFYLSLGAIVICLGVCGFFFFTAITRDWGTLSTKRRRAQTSYTIFYSVIMLFFILGVAEFAYFAVKNIK